MLTKIKDICKILLFFLFILVFMVFVFSNTAMVKISLFPFSTIIEIRLFLLVIFTFMLGFLFAMFLNFSQNIFSDFKNNRKISNLEKEIKILKIKSNDKNEKNI